MITKYGIHTFFPVIIPTVKKKIQTHSSFILLDWILDIINLTNYTQDTQFTYKGITKTITEKWTQTYKYIITKHKFCQKANPTVTHIHHPKIPWIVVGGIEFGKASIALFLFHHLLPDKVRVVTQFLHACDGSQGTVVQPPVPICGICNFLWNI